MANCGRPKANGEPCKFPMIYGKCPTHDAPDLVARNRKVRAAFAERDPAGYHRAQSIAGVNGSKVVIERDGIEAFIRRMARGARKKPSAPERWLQGLLAGLAYPGYVFQDVVKNNEGTFYILDFHWPGYHILVELDGWRHISGSFGLDEAAMAWYRARLAAKVAWMESIGTSCLVLEYERRHEAALGARVVGFLDSIFYGLPTI